MADGTRLPRLDDRPAGQPVVSAHSSAPGRTVLTERGNADGWIASDVAVDAMP